MLYYLEPEVAGGFGEDAVVNTASHPPVVTRLEYKFESWLGDEVLETFPCFIVTEAVASKITKRNLTGFSLDSVKISKSEEFDEMEPLTVLPKFLWLKVEGQAGVSDFGIATDHRLVVSDKAKSALEKHQLQYADFENFVG